MWIRLALFILWWRTPTVAERNLYTGILLDKVKALPLHDIISKNDAGEILVSGQTLDIDKARMLMESAKAALMNQSLKIVRERVLWSAVQQGLAKGLAPDELLFFRAAIWFGEEETKHLRILAGLENDQEPTL